MSEDERALMRLARLIAGCDSLLFITGAGISADSGLPTYRGIGGLYDERDTDEGVSIEEALSGPMLRRRPGLTWKYLWQIGAACHGAEPNAAHRFIAELQQSHRVSVLTQNVDGLHRKAGSQDLLEVHGRAQRLECMGCAAQYDAATVIGSYTASVALPPRCACGAVLRPRVVLFEEMLPTEVVLALDELDSKHFDAVIVVGTTALFPYVVQPALRARACRRPTVEINPSVSALSGLVDFRIARRAADALSAIRERLGVGRSC